MSKYSDYIIQLLLNIHNRPKMYIDSNITIHFNYDPINDLYDDFKIVNPK